MTRKGPDDSYLLERELTGAIIGAFFECYNRLEFGYLESVYRRALVVELQLQGHRCVREGLIEVLYKGVCVGNYRYDLLVDGRVLVEVKSGDSLPSTAKRQLLNYLRGTEIEVGLLLHFGPQPRFFRCVHQRFID
ncbi:MAG: GxxExxY protein [Gemmatimonadaceae bacterium]